MKTILLILLILGTGCNPLFESQENPNKTPDGFEIVVIDSCEYIFHRQEHMGEKPNTESLIHKANCSNLYHKNLDK